MNLKFRARRLAIATSLALLSAFSLPLTVEAQDEAGTGSTDRAMYVGGLIGFGMPMGTGPEVDSGLAYGGTLGWKLLPTLGIAFTYLHDDLSTTLGDLDYSVDKYLFEANFFSLAGLGAGIHAGPVTTDVAGLSQTDLGLGANVGIDIMFTSGFSFGVMGYWTYILADDKYATLDILGTVRFWF